MRQFCAIIFTILFISVLSTKGQVVTVTNFTNTTPNLTATYGSLSAAITALNAITAISGPVTITLNPGFPQTAPAGGYAIQFATVNNTAASPITITGSNNTITAFTPQTAGFLYDGIFKLIGADYITIQNFVMQENGGNTVLASNTNTMTEWGVALLHKSTTDGAQNNTIQNNTISLNRTYQNSFGVYSNARHSPTVIGTLDEITNNSTGPNSNNKVYNNAINNVNMGISFIGGAGVATNMDLGNDIGGGSAATGNTITNWGGAALAISNFFSNSATYHGIFMNHQKNDNVSYNTVTSAAINGTTTTVRGIQNRYASTAPTGTFSVTISNNIVSLINNNTSGNFECIFSEQITSLTTATVNITNNSIINNSSGLLTMVGINNTAACGVLNITNNIFRNNTSSATTTGFTAITNTGAVTTTVNINNNIIGDGSGNAISFSAATSGALTGINCLSVAATASVSINNNNFQGFVQSVNGSGAHSYIVLGHAPSGATTDNINGNTFTNLTANTTGNVRFISRSGAMAMNAGATQNCNNNSIVTGFSKPAAGNTVSLFFTGSTCLSGNTMNETGNNFSNITLTGATDMAGWDNEEGTAGSGPTKTISNNTFTNWNCGDGYVNVIQSDFSGNNSVISGNTISNISTTNGIAGIFYGTATKLTHTISNNDISILSGGNSVWGISAGSGLAASMLNVTGNIIHNVVSTGAFSAVGIRIGAGLNVNISKNKIYDINAQNVGCAAGGMEIASSTAGAIFNISNNTVGDIKGNLSNNPAAINGIIVTGAPANSSFNIYYNTIYLNATSSGTNFGSAALFLSVSTTPTTGAATLRNNIFVNLSTANGTGVSAAYRRNGVTFADYVLASNNNIFYAGTPGPTKVIFYDNTNSDQTLAAFKTRVGPTREANSFTEMPTFLSLSGASANFLHLDPTAATQAESGAINIAGYTDDYDGNIRQGNGGYVGTGTAPDIGADEIEGIYSELIPPVVNSYPTLSSPICSVSNRTITGVNITDATGVPLSGANRPRIYYRKNTGTWFSQPGTNTSGTIANSNWDFTIVVSDMGGLVGGDIVSYYVIAQDLNPVPNTASYPSAGLAATGVNAVTTHPTSPNTYVYGYNLIGTYTVGATGNFPTLTAAIFAYNNACSLAGPTIFELIDDSYGSETFPIAINYRADANSTNTLTIRPSATAIPVFTYATGTLEQLINLNGARYITFDGRQGGAGTVKSLSFTSTGLGIAFLFINDAQNNTIKYCNVAAHKSSNFFGTITFLTAGAGTGNDNNTIDNNEIYDAPGGFSNNGIYSGGTGGQENDNITVTNNNISNYFSATNDSHGIWVGLNSNAWTITGNRFFQTATRVYTSNPNVFAIYVTTGTGYTVSNNIIGYANASGTGTTNMIGNSVPLAGFPASYTTTGAATALRYAGIGLSLGNFGTPSTVDGNTIGGIAMFTSSNASTFFGMFGGIYIESGTVNIGVGAGNIIGGTTGNNSIYVATTTSGGTIVGIRASSVGSVSIQNNTIGSIISSGTANNVAGSFTGINVAGLCNFTISNNEIGNSTANNIQVGYAASGGFLTNSGTLTANISGSSTFRGIVIGATGNTQTITNNTLRGWNTSCATTAFTGIQTSGALFGSAGVVNINNNFLGTAARNWINNANNNTGLIYGIDLNNTGVLTLNVKNNDFIGNIFGTTFGAGGGLIRLLGSTASNNITTISGNTFTNLSVFFSGASRYLYFIYTSYNLLSTAQLIIDNNQIVGTCNSTGAVALHMVNCSLASSAGASLSITNNNFSNITAATGFTTSINGLYSSLSNGSGIVTITGNTIGNLSSGTGGITGIDISDMSGTATCSNNIISTIALQGDFEGISINTSSTSGSFNITNNSVSGVTSSGAGGFANGITGYIPSVSNTAQINITKNSLHGFSSTNSIAIIAGIYLESGHATSTVSVNSNKIYDLAASSSGCRVYGVYNSPTLRGNFTYTNNCIGDLRAPNSTVADQAVTGIKLYLLAGLAKVYYNSIYLNASAAVAPFSSAAVFADAATAVTLRNNIFINVSAHGASGRTVAYWRGSTNLLTYDASSNNNLFYAGTPSVRDLIFYDGTNSDQALAAYQVRVSTRDNLSVTALPNFISTTGSNANFLHIATTGNCAVNARGNNAGILLTSDYDNDSRSTVAPFVTDIGADEFSKKNAWTGANGTNWNDTGNWSEGVVPNTDDDNVLISTPPVNQPVIAPGEVYQVASVIIGAGASLTNRGTLKVAGSIYTANTGSFNNIQAGIVEGSIEMNGNCSIIQTLAGNVFAGNAVNNFTAGNHVTISPVAGEHLNVSGELGFGAVSSKTLITGDNITLVSTFNATANVGKILNGNIISGKASVERYINTGTGGGQHAKGWQFLATPAKGQTISQAWQENVTPTAGYGTIITGTGSGFDFTTVLPSLKFYDPTIGTNGDWVGVTTTGAQIDEKRGYMIFVRGDRTVTAYNAPATPTRMRINGTLFQPNDPPAVTNVLANKWVSVGNPYASSIDLNYMKNNSLFVNLNNDAVVWDPLLYGAYGYGGYQTLAAANNYEPTAGGTAYYAAGTPSPYIQSGQAFFIHSSGSAGTVTFTEAAKVSSDRLVNKPAPLSNRQYFRASLFTNTGIIADGNAVAFENVYNNAVDRDDAIKMANSGENFGITRAGKNLSVEARKPVAINDTIYYTLSNLRKQTYQFRFAPKNMQGSGLNAYLIDKYLQTTTQLSISDSSFVNIDITNNPLSAAADRFYVVFKKRLLVPIQNLPHVSEFAKEKVIQKAEPVRNNTEASISIYPNPVENKTIQLHFVQQETGTYRIQLINNLGQPVYNDNIVINTPSSTNLMKIDAGIAAGNYLLNIYAENGVKTVLRVIIK